MAPPRAARFSPRGARGVANSILQPHRGPKGGREPIRRRAVGDHLPSLNQIQLIGHLTRDPEKRFTPSGTAVTKFGLAVNRSWKKGDEWQEEVCFIDVTAWGKTGEGAAANLCKGSEAAVFGD